MIQSMRQVLISVDTTTQELSILNNAAVLDG